jgi:hypothetical protein
VRSPLNLPGNELRLLPIVPPQFNHSTPVRNGFLSGSGKNTLSSPLVAGQLSRISACIFALKCYCIARRDL